MPRRDLQPGGRRLAIERLEDRRVLATLTVTMLSDAAVTDFGSAPGTLRQAIYDANHTDGPDVIEFAANLSGSINLSTVDDSTAGASSLLVTSPVTIRGNANGITIGRDAAAAEMRLIRVTQAGNLTVEMLGLTGGLIRGAHGVASGEDGGRSYGGAILNEGMLQVVSSTIYANQAIGGNAGAGGRAGAGVGGGIFNDHATLSLTNVTVSGNSASTGSGGVASSFGGALGGHNGSITIRNSTITNSSATAGRGVYVLADDTTFVEIQSSIIGQSGPATAVRDLLVALETFEVPFTVTGADNLIRGQNDFGSITVSAEDPMLGSLANNGGPTLTHALVAESPATDHGNNEHGLQADQRGGSYARFVGTATDIGAFELQTAVPPNLPGDYNQNNIVNAADYVLWRKTLDNMVPQYSGADGNGNGVVDAGDYDVWRQHFGQTPQAAAAGTGAIASDASSEVTSPTASILASPPVGFRFVRSVVNKAATATALPNGVGAIQPSSMLLLALRTPDSPGDLSNDGVANVASSGPSCNGIAVDAVFGDWQGVEACRWTR